MQIIAYKINGEPCSISPAVAETDILDADGNPTGETTTTDNLQQLIAALPAGTEYELVDAADAASWWEDNLSPDELEAGFSGLVTARLDAFAAQRQYDNITSARLAALSSDFTADGQTAQAAYDATWTAAIALMPDVRAGTKTPEQAVEELPALAWPGD
jgi:hypothetical protein